MTVHSNRMRFKSSVVDLHYVQTSFLHIALHFMTPEQTTQVWSELPEKIVIKKVTTDSEKL